MPLHPQAQEFVDFLEATNPPGWEVIGAKLSRQTFATFKDRFGEGPDLPSVQDRTINDVPIRYYCPDESKTLPAVMYFHGGGWVLGSLDTHDAVCRRLAHDSGCAVIAVDYRLAPEHKYPAAIDDSYVATKYVAEHPGEFRIDPRRLAVAGDSAGGNLAAAVAIRARDESARDERARDEEVPNIHLQVLIYPVIEPNFLTRSYLDFATGYGLTKAAMAWFWRQYLKSDSQKSEPLAVPSNATDLSRLPTAHVVTSEYDVLRDEGESYADKLRGAGVEVTLDRYPGMLHGFVNFAGIFDDGVTATSDIAKIIKQKFSP